MVIGRLRQNDQTADEIAGDVLQAETNAYANRARENRQRGEMNSGVFQDMKCRRPARCC